MWAPHPRGRVIRRPPPDFSHRRLRLKKRPAPKELLDSVPDPRCNYKYFGIHRSDVTDHLKQQVPSHAFHPSLVGAPPPVPNGRSSRLVKETRRPETAPASSVWFGRTCSDVSDWLRYRPPAHLGLDPDNKPLPHYPSTTSIVTDNKWQTREYPALPNVLWHWWKDRPSSVPLPTKPQQVKFETLVDAVKQRIVRPRGPYTPPTSGPPSSAPTPRSGAQTPHEQTPRNQFPAGDGETQHSRAQTPQLQGSGDQFDPKSMKDFPTRPSSASSSIFTPRPASAPSSRPASAPNGMPTNLPPSTARSKNGSMDGSPRLPSTPNHYYPTVDGPKSLKPLGPCGCENSRDTPRSSGSVSGGRTSGLPPTGKPPQVEPHKCAFDRISSSQVPIPPLNLQVKANGETSSTTPTQNKPPTPTIGIDNPPRSPGPSHPNPPHVPRQPSPRKPCGRHHSAVPSGLYVQGQGSNTRRVERKTPRESQEPTLDDMKHMSPNSFATKIIWAEKFKQHGQALPWPLEEKKGMKVVKAY